MRYLTQGRGLRLVIVIAHGNAMAQFLLLALASLTLGQQPQTPVEAPQPFVNKQDIADAIRLAATPKIDGVIDPEEWDPFYQSGDLDSYFEWEPSKLYLAAKAPVGDEIVFSFDLKGNGWLVGRDNLEVRLKRTESGVQVRGRVLDADNKTGPKWIDMPGISTASMAASTISPDGKTWTVEAALTDPGTGYFPDSPGGLSARVDAIPEDAAETPSYVPRLLTPLHFSYKRATGLPGGVYWEPQHEGQYVVPGDTLRLRYTFKGDNAAGLTRIAMRSEGYAKDSTSALELPFPRFDSKNRAFVDYNSKIAPDASVGYRIARAVITSKDGGTAMGQASYRVASPMDMELVPQEIKRSINPNLVKVTVYLRSNTSDKMRGNLHLTPPTGFAVLSGNDSDFVLYHTGTARKVVQLSIPASAVGTFAVDLTAKVGHDTYHETGYLTIQY